MRGSCTCSISRKLDRLGLQVDHVDGISIVANANDSHWLVLNLDVHHRRLVIDDNYNYNTEGIQPVHRELGAHAIGFWAKEVKIRTGMTLPTNWELVRSDVPRQNNSNDCGPMALLALRCRLEGRPWCFNQSHVPHYRRMTTRHRSVLGAVAS